MPDQRDGIPEEWGIVLTQTNTQTKIIEKIGEFTDIKSALNALKNNRVNENSIWKYDLEAKCNWEQRRKIQ